MIDLPARVRALVATGELSMGHARAIATAADPEALADEVVRRGLSVHETEKVAREAHPPSGSSTKAGGAAQANAVIDALWRQSG